MKRAWGIVLPALVLLIFLFAVSSPAGVILVDRDGSKTLISKGKLKNVTEGESQTIIFDADSEVMTVIDGEKRAYARGTVEEFCGEVSSIMGDAMKGMSEEEKAMMLQFMNKGKQKKTGAPLQVEVAREGSGGKLAGLSTVKYSVKVDGKPFEEVWLTEDGTIMREFKSLSKLADMTSKMAGCTLGEVGMDFSGTPYASPQYRDLFKKGYPVKIVSLDEGSLADGDEVVEVRKESIPGSEFEPPGDYRELSFKELMHLDK
jgi:hypothetical protein